jgi:hypothetical protein
VDVVGGGNEARASERAIKLTLPFSVRLRLIEQARWIGTRQSGSVDEVGTLIDGGGVLIFWCSAVQCNARARRFRRKRRLMFARMGGWVVEGDGQFVIVGGGWTGPNCDSRANEA